MVDIQDVPDKAPAVAHHAAEVHQVHQDVHAVVELHVEMEAHVEEVHLDAVMDDQGAGVDVDLGLLEDEVGNLGTGDLEADVLEMGELDEVVGVPEMDAIRNSPIV